MTEVFEHVCTRTCSLLHRCTIKNWKADLSKFEVVLGLWCLDAMQEEDSTGTIKSFSDCLQALSFLLYHTNLFFFFFFNVYLRILQTNRYPVTNPFLLTLVGLYCLQIIMLRYMLFIKEVSEAKNC